MRVIIERRVMTHSHLHSRPSVDRVRPLLQACRHSACISNTAKGNASKLTARDGQRVLLAVQTRCVADAVTPSYTRCFHDCRIQASAKARLHCLRFVVRNVAFAIAWRASDKPCVCFRTQGAGGAASRLRPHACPCTATMTLWKGRDSFDRFWRGPSQCREN